MDADGRLARGVGVLFITATVASIVGTGLSSAFLAGPDMLAKVASNATQVSVGVLLELLAAFSCAGIAISLYPVLSRFSPGLSLGSVVFRATEGALYLVAAASLLALVALAQGSSAADGVPAAPFTGIGTALLDMRQQVSLMGVFAFGLGGLLYYVVFWQSRLIPRWLSGWGLLGIVLMLGACMAAMTGQRPIQSYVIVMLPIAVQEMVLAAWLIAKGFDAHAIEGLPRASVSMARAGVAS